MKLEKAIAELYKKTATIIPADVESSLRSGMASERKNSLAYSIFSNMLRNINLAKEGSLPLCQDTGVPVFYVSVPIGVSHYRVRQAIINATRKATMDIPLRPNAVDVLGEANTGDNVGLGTKKEEVQQPIIYIEQWDRDHIKIDLMLKGGGSENIGVQYKLPDKELGAGRDMEGVKRCIIDAVFKAQGKGCPPYILGVAIGGSKDLIARESKRQLLRRIDDTNEDDRLAEMEEGLKDKINSLGIGPAGLGGKTTVLGVKIKTLHRHPASFFVDVSFMCWACRRGTLTCKGGDAALG
ncbi:fumarate hydratase [Candidatus Woesearchaeota archaeon]|nr:fumarate hydratase [Candidatus Woesearchaeota archaeon]